MIASSYTCRALRAVWLWLAALVVDGAVRDGALPFADLTYLVRTSAEDWREGTRDEVLQTRYGSPHPAANGIVVARQGA